MRSAIRHLPAVAFLGFVLTGGCAAHPAGSDAPDRWHNSAFHPTVPERPFATYEAAFKYIATNERLPGDRHTLLALAVDSTVTRCYFDATGDLAVIRAEYYGESRFGIRGAQGQGRYYTFQVGPGGWRLVGIFHGNDLRWEAEGDSLRAITLSHFSAFESDETVYTWNGKLFE
jgi:hypothetical protein